MSEIETDQEQLDKIKKWWDENGKTTVLGLVVGLGGVFGWTGWQSYKQAEAESASALYQQMANAASEDRFDAVQEHAQALLDAYPNSGYATLATFYRAKAAVVEERKDEAKAHLQWIVDNASVEEYRTIARLRLARLQLAEGNVDIALNLAGGADNGAFQASFDVLRGDALIAQGKPEEARAAYQAALDAFGPTSPETAVLQLKLDDLGHLNVPKS